MKLEYELYTPSAGWERRSRQLSGKEMTALRARAADIASVRRPAAEHTVSPDAVLRLSAEELAALAELAEIKPGELRDRATAIPVGNLMRLYVPAEQPTKADWLQAAQELFGRRAGFPAHGDRRIVSL